ncbi:methyltransferase domain-containing protein [candidate division WOR-3 bacterium]|nr:methyltransferase domain-containing protein [candidate division WOR-3 bacterium]
MRKNILSYLVCPVCKSDLSIKVEQTDGEHIEEGELICKNNNCGKIFRITNGVPRLLVEEKDSNVKQTSNSFNVKWNWYPRFGFDGSSAESHYKWYNEKYHWTKEKFKSFLSTKRLILDAGCGTGHDVALYANMTRGEVFGVDIGSADLAYQNTKSLSNTHIIQADVLNLPFEKGLFDFIASEGVLHHTSSTKLAFESLVNCLTTRGEIQIYVYKQKAPIREFSDDYIREITTKLSPEECWKVCEGITKLGKEISDLKIDIKVPDIPVLRIKQGKYDIQRFIFYHFLKCFWNDDFSFDENVMTNFDWYHPKHAHRHTPDEVKGWFTDMEIVVFDIGDSGITVRGIKK